MCDENDVFAPRPWVSDMIVGIIVGTVIVVALLVAWGCDTTNPWG